MEIEVEVEENATAVEMNVQRPEVGFSSVSPNVEPVPQEEVLGAAMPPPSIHLPAGELAGQLTGPAPAQAPPAGTGVFNNIPVQPKVATSVSLNPSSL